MKVTRKQCSEYLVHQFVTFASDLGWPPGVQYTELETDIGNQRPFILQSRDADKAIYLQANGCVKLAVYND